MKNISRPFTLSAITILLADLLMMYAEPDVLLCIFLLSALLCLTLSLLRHYSAKLLLVITVCLALSALTYEYSSATADAMKTIEGKNVPVRGIVHSYPEETEGGYYYFTLRECNVNGKDVYGKMMIYASDTYDIAPGDEISLTANELYPSDSSGVFRFHSLSQKTYISAFSQGRIKTEQIHGKYDIYTAVLTLRKAINEKYEDNLQPDNAAIASALVSGDKGRLPAEIDSDMKLCGVSHIFAVSGMHLSIWTGVFFLIFRQRSRSAKIPNIAAIIFVLFYCIFTGFSPSVLRSGIMLTAVFAGKLIRRHSDELNSWGIAGTFLMLYNPFLAGNVSFLLSFTATFALIVLSPYLIPEHKYRKDKLQTVRKRMHAASDDILSSVAVMLMTLPICAYYFGYISLLSPIISLILTPLAEILMILSAISAFIPEGNVISELIFNATDVFGSLIKNTLQFGGKLDFAVLPVDIALVLPWFILSTVAIVITVFLIKNKKAVTVTLLVSITALTAATAINQTLHKNETSVYIPSSVNGTCISIVGGSGTKAAVFGSGGDFKAASDTLDFLNSEGALTSDYLIIPGKAKTERGNTGYLTRKLMPSDTVNVYSKTGNTVKYSQSLWDGTQIYTEYSDTFGCALVVTDDIRIVICTLPSSDFSTADSKFTSGDILICREAIPETVDTQNFNTIILTTDIETQEDSSRILSTYEHDITITVKGDTYAIDR